MLKLPPLALYIHYPYCIKKCPYCDFNSYESSSKNGYIEALLKDLDNDLKYVQNRQINSIFIGGGTPSLLSINELEEMFSGLKKRLDFAKDIEITIEANPGAFEVKKFKYLRQIGINRLSIGVQSFKNKKLKFLGRIHSADDAIYAIKQAKKVGFANINIDLMYGLKNQSIADCLTDLTKAIELKPSHISFYELTIEPNTYFAAHPPELPNKEDIYQMGSCGARLLEKNGFKQYEVSAFAKIPSRHNLNYWQFGDYIGIGAGSHGKISLVRENSLSVIRTTKIKSPKDYLKQQQKSIKKVDDLSFEFMLNALRLKNGFDTALFESRTNIPINAIKTKLNQSQKLGLLDINKNHLRATTKGFNFLNDLQQIFLYS